MSAGVRDVCWVTARVVAALLLPKGLSLAPGLCWEGLPLLGGHTAALQTPLYTSSCCTRGTAVVLLKS